MNIEDIFEKNKKNTNRFIEALKRGDRGKLDQYFKISKENNINLFDYSTPSETPFDAIIKLINKELKDKDSIESKIYLDDLFFYLNKNGFLFYQEELIDSRIHEQFPYISNYYNLRFNIKASIQKKINIYDYILKFSAENESTEHIKHPEKLVNKTNSHFFGNEYYNSYIRSLYKANKFINVFQIKPYNLEKLTRGKNKVFSSTEEILKAFKKEEENKELNNYIMYKMCESKDKKFLYNLVEKNKSAFRPLKEIILSWEKFNMNLNQKTKDEYYSLEQYSFIKDSRSEHFKLYLEKLIYFNENNSTEKMILDKKITDVKNYIKIISYFSPSRFSFSYDNYKSPEQVKLELQNINLICDEDLLVHLFEDKFVVNFYKYFNYTIKEFSYILDNWIKEEDVKKNITNIKMNSLIKNIKNNSSFYNNIEQHINETYKMISYLLESYPQYINEFLYSQKMSEQLKIIKISKKIKEVYFEKENFKIEKFLNIDNFKDEDYYVKEDELYNCLLDYLNNEKKDVLNQNMSEKIYDFCKNAHNWSMYKPNEFIQKAEVIILYDKIRDVDIIPKNKKRL